MPPVTTDPFKLIDDYINKHDWRVKEDSNRSYSLHGLSTHLANSVQALYWLNKIYPKSIAQAHQQGFYHIHDLVAGRSHEAACINKFKSLIIELKEFLVPIAGRATSFMDNGLSPAYYSIE
jgi:anaerobic ribonucleoside-triphosphate reductase